MAISVKQQYGVWSRAAAKQMRSVVTGITLTAGIALAPAAASAESLTDALIGAYEHSHLLDQNRALLRAADEDVAQAMTLLRPVVSFIGSSSFNPNSQNPSNVTTTLGLSASMTLFDNGRSQLSIDAAKETVLATREALRGLEQNVLFSAVSAYLDVLSATDNVGLRANNVRVLNEQLRAAQDRFDVGEVTRTDVALAESALAQARAGEARAQGDLMIARESYRIAVGRYPGTLTAVPGAPSLPSSQADAEGIAVRTHPDIRAAQRNITVAELTVASAEAAQKFTVSGEANLGVADVGNGFDDTASLSLTLRQPILGAGANGAGFLGSRLRQANNRLEAERANLLNTTHTVRQLVGNAWANLQATSAQVQATDRQIAAAQIAFRGVQEEAKLGARTTLDVLNAEQDLLDARTARVDAEANRYLAVYALLSSMGLLTVEHLNLGINTYDPAAYYNAVKSAPVPMSRQGRQLEKVLQRLGNN